jgi:hypothetical protein
MAERSLFIGFGTPARGREARALEVFNEFVQMCAGMGADGRIESFEVTLLDQHGGDLGGFFLLQGTTAQCAALQTDPEFRRAIIDAGLAVDSIGVVPGLTGEAIGPDMAAYAEGVAKVTQTG